MHRLANRQSEDKQSRIMLLKTILLALPLILTTPLLVVSQEREIYLSMQQFDRTIDHAHAQCASIDLEFSQNFYNCLEDKMEGIYIDSSTIHSQAGK
jgi:hypothetical protein